MQEEYGTAVAGISRTEGGETGDGTRDSGDTEVENLNAVVASCSFWVYSAYRRTSLC